MGQLPLRAAPQPSQRVWLKQEVLGSFERSLGRDNATCEEGEVLTDTSEYSDTLIYILMWYFFSLRFEIVESWQVYMPDSQLLCMKGQTGGLMRH